MFKLIKEGELRFPEKPPSSNEAKDFIIRVNFYFWNIYIIYMYIKKKQTIMKKIKYI
jgi:hypothetical protein